MKKILCILLLFSTLTLSACCVLQNEDDLLSENPKRFDTVSDMRIFYSANRFRFGGGFLCLDLNGNDGLYLGENNREPTHLFGFGSIDDNKFTDPLFASEYHIYSEKLGTDTDSEDVPYHSITVCFISTVYSDPFGTLKYEFDTLDEDRWGYVVKIYSGEKHVAELYYSTGLNIEQEWLENFLSKHIVRVFL